MQQALDRTLEAFPGFRSIIKHGLFWYYLEITDQKPLVKQEDEPPCSPIFDKNVKNLLFTVTYYQNRINLEIYHALADGTGALQFLRVLVYHYLTLRHPEAFGEQPPSIDYDASVTQRMDDSFQKYYDKSKRKGKSKAQPAYHLRGQKVAEHRIQVLEGILSVKAMLAKAREYHTTVTVLLTSILMCAIHEEMAVRDEKKPVAITVPVNLRKYFYSESARNFFGIINVRYCFAGSSDKLEDVIESVSQSFQRELEPQQLERRMNAMAAIEHNVFARIVPLVVKDFFLRAAYNLTAREETAALSNIGRVDMPKEFAPYIRLFDVFVSTAKVQICMCSYGDNMTVSFTSCFVSTDIQRRFFRTLTDMGLQVEINANQVDEEEEA